MISGDTNKIDDVSVSIQLNDIKVQFSGDPENVLLSTINFLTKHIPELRLAQKISLNYSVSELIDMYSSIIKITPEGPKILPNLGEIHNKKFSDKEIVMLFLLGSKIAFELGKTPEKSSPISDIQTTTNLNPKSISSRLSELVKVGYVTKSVTKETQTESVVYGITTIGIKWLNDVMNKKFTIR
jgi:predicted transcriptional regulator